MKQVDLLAVAFDGMGDGIFGKETRQNLGGDCLLSPRSEA